MTKTDKSALRSFLFDFFPRQVSAPRAERARSPSFLSGSSEIGFRKGAEQVEKTDKLRYLFRRSVLAQNLCGNCRKRVEAGRVGFHTTSYSLRNFLDISPPNPLTKTRGSNILFSLCGHGGTGRRVRLRGVWITPSEFKSRWPHQRRRKANFATALRVFGELFAYAPCGSFTRRENARRSFAPRFSLRCKTVAPSLIFTPRVRLAPPFCKANFATALRVFGELFAYAPCGSFARRKNARRSFAPRFSLRCKNVAPSQLVRRSPATRSIRVFGWGRAKGKKKSGASAPLFCVLLF